MEQQPNNQKENQDPQKGRKRNFFIAVIVCLLILLILFGALHGLTGQASAEKITYDEFVGMVEDNRIEKIVVDSDKLKVTSVKKDKNGDPIRYEVNMVGDENALLELVGDRDIELSKKEADLTASIVSALMSIVVPLLLVVVGFSLIMRYMNKSGGLMGVGKSKARSYVQQETGITFQDVAGQDEAKESLQEVVDFLHNPENYTKIGAKLPKGALLVGPPGTGKTLLAKAVAGEAHVPFFSLSGSEFVEMFVGMGAARVRDLFKQAAEKAPCIVFIDEIDTIGKSRDNAAGVSGGNDEREQTLNQLLTEMDGFDGSKGVIILAATNRPETLDKALLRPGRFDRRIPVELPDLEGRAAILKVHAKKVLVDENVDFMAIARATSGASGAELANMINEAALRAVKHNRRIVNQEDLMEAVETVIAGYQRKNKVLSPKEKRIVAYHEIGHALVAAKQTESAPVAKITIVPRTSGALGYTLQVPEQETNLMSREEVLNKIATLTGGRAAEELIFGSYTTGASNDIEQATRLARNMVTRLGMSDQFDMMALSVVNNQYLGGDSSLVCSEGTAAKVDDEVLGIIKSAHAKARKILEENLDKLHELSAFLMERESITGEEFMEILNRPASEEGTQASEEEKEKPESNQ